MATNKTINYSNATYEGETTYYNGGSVPHGKGIAKYTDGSVYEGYFRYGKQYGQGKLSIERDPNDGISQVCLEVGEFRDNHFVKGTRYYENGASIEGNFEHGAPVGEVKFTYSNGNYVYAPVISEERKEGKAFVPKLSGKKVTIYYKDGSIYFQGWFNKKNKFDYGKLYYENGDWYEGSFKNNNFHGLGSYYHCISQRHNIYLEVLAHFKQNEPVKRVYLSVGDDLYYSAKRIKKGYEIYYLAALKTVNRFVNYDVNKNVFTKDHALYERVASRLLKDYPYSLSVLMKFLNVTFAYYDFEARFSYKDGKIDENPHITNTDDLVWNFIFQKATDFVIRQCYEAFGSRKDTIRILNEIKSQDDFQKEYITFSLSNGEYHDGKAVHTANKIQPKEDKPFVYNYDRSKRIPTKRLSIKFVLKEFGYQIFEFSYFLSNHRLVIPEAYGHKKIKSIRPRCFAYHSEIYLVDIPGNIKIGLHAFYNCKNLETIIISGDFQKIDPAAFERLPNLKHIVYFDTKQYWLLFHAKQQWLKYIDSKYIVTVHCKDGDLTL